MCHKKFELVKDNLLATLKEVPYVAITTDLWTTQAYITMIVHFITELWTMESKVLLTQEMPECHTAVNASNMNLAMQFLGDWGDLPCFGHTLQLAVNSGLDLAPVRRLTAVCCKLVGHFKHSVVAMGAQTFNCCVL